MNRVAFFGCSCSFARNEQSYGSIFIRYLYMSGIRGPPYSEPNYSQVFPKK